MPDNITINVNDGKCIDITTTNGYLLVYLNNQEFKFKGTLSLKDLAPMLLKYAMEKMVKHD